MDTFQDDIGQYLQFPEDENGQHLTDDALLGQTKDVVDHGHFYSAGLVLQSPLVEDAAPSHPIQEPFHYADDPTLPFPAVQTTSLPFGSALRPTHAAEYSAPPISEPCPTDATFWSYAASAMEPNQSQSSAGLGIFDLWRPPSSCPCVDASKGLICSHQLFSSVAWDEAATEAGKDKGFDMQPSPEMYSAALHHQFGPLAVPAQIAHQGLFTDTQCQGYPLNGGLSMPNWYAEDATLANAHAHISGPTIDSHLPVPPTPASSAYVSTPGSSGVSSSTSPETSSLPIPSPRKKRLQRPTPYDRLNTGGQHTDPSSSMGATDAVVLQNARKGIRQFVKAHPHDLEPGIGDPAANAILGATLRLGTPGKSLYSALFVSGRSGKPRFTCYECGHVDTRFNRAARHQRQDHFGHYPFQCQGGAGHPACGQWFSSDEYAKDHASKAELTGFICTECSKVFSNVGNLGRHKKKYHHA